MDVQQSQREAARLGIQGVPFLVLDGRYAVSGAQPTSVFVDALKRAATD
jgi:predicted DsbA family dithiol-disulfide isomerase